MIPWLALALAGPVDTLELSVGDHSVAPPFGNIWPRGAVRPTVLAGVGHLWVDTPAFDLVPAARGGIFVHPHAGSGWRLGPELAARVTAPFGPFLDTNVGIGVAHTMHGMGLRPTDDGGYEPARDPGRLGATLGFGLGTGFDLTRVSDVPLAVVVDYRWYGLVGWLPAVGVGPMADLTVGVRWFVGREAM